MNNFHDGEYIFSGNDPPERVEIFISSNKKNGEPCCCYQGESTLESSRRGVMHPVYVTDV